MTECRYAYHVSADAYRDQKRALGPLKLELAAVVTHLICVVETKPRSFTRTLCTLNSSLFLMRYLDRTSRQREIAKV